MLLVRTYEAGLLDARGDSRSDRKSALMWASKLGMCMVSTVLKLLDLSACVELTDEDGMTAQHSCLPPPTDTRRQQKFS